MSVPNPNKPHKHSFHWRNDSEELDVFEAAGYFSTVNDAPNPSNIIREDRQYERVPKPGRISLDSLAARNPMIPAGEHRQKQTIKEISGKKCKQPSSPGGRLASFLNALFHQASLKKKKKPKSGGAGGGVPAEEEISPGGSRRRRSSISHFRITTTSAADSKATLSSSSGSGFRTPPAYVNTPTKSYKEFRCLPDRRQKAIDCKNPEINEEKIMGVGKSGVLSRNSVAAEWSDNSWDQLRNLREEEDEDDGGESDSSSDLFDLPNHELDFYSRDLPVYGTTQINRINNCKNFGAPISSATS